MGDNIYLGDRNGVRTPMQWTGDRNAGFSRATPAKLFSPVVMDPVWGYEAINVEAQAGDPSSLLSWMRNMIALRKLFSVFGRGSLKFLHPSNRKVLAYIRASEDATILCVANLSRFAQPVQLDLSEYAGMVPVEMLGYVEFPKLDKTPYAITLGQYGFLWLELQGAPEPLAERLPDRQQEPVIQLAGERDWTGAFRGEGRGELQTLLPQFLMKQRWFGGKSKQITGATLKDWAPFDQGRAALVFVDIGYASGEPDTYLVPLAIAMGEAGSAMCEHHGSSVLSKVVTPAGEGYLYDAMLDDSTAKALLALIADAGELQTQNGVAHGMPSTRWAELRGDAAEILDPKRGSAEQSNTNILFGQRLIMKLFRRQQMGPNPDTEIGKYLTESTSFRNIAPFAGAIEFAPAGHAEDPEFTSTLAMVQGLVPNEGDGWEWTLEELGRFLEDKVATPLPEEQRPPANLPLLALVEGDGSPVVHEQIGAYLDAAALLGRRTAEMHLALATPTSDAAFAPEPFGPADVQRLRTDLAMHAVEAFDALKENLARLPDAVVEPASLILSRRRQILARFQRSAPAELHSLRTRVHGDYHLGQVLRSRGDFVILDFEGEPARSLAERRTKQPPMKDVAGMLRSFSYAAATALTKWTTRHPNDLERLEPWARLWEQSVCSAFLRSYRQTAAGSEVVPASLAGFAELLNLFVLDKALYELVYELNNRPLWVRIPLAGILALDL